MRGLYARYSSQSSTRRGMWNCKFHQSSSHWGCYFKDGMKRSLYFDSFGQTTPAEIQKYLKTKKEYETGKAVVQRNTDIVQHVNTHVCGHLCLFVLTSLTRKHQSYQDVLNQLSNGYTQADFVVPYQKYTGPYNPRHEQLDEYDQLLALRGLSSSLDKSAFKNLPKKPRWLDRSSTTLSTRYQ